jgi:hypothetical protein
MTDQREAIAASQMLMLQRRVTSLEQAVDTLKRALVDQARMLHNAQDQLREVKDGR